MTSGEDPSEDDGRVLAPEELDISEDEHVAEIDDGRYVVSPDDPIDDPPTASADSGDTRQHERESEPDRQPETDQSPGRGSDLFATDSQSGGDSGSASLDAGEVDRWLQEKFRDADSRYGFHVTATFDGRVFQRRMMSNDVVTIFESLILWYAQHIDSETPVEEILGILLTETNVPISYPTESLSRAIKAHGLGPDDSIGELLEAIDEDGFEL
ncbi:DUF7500 family protein [Halapricum desulfuricans]|nr:hypothetical protein [Halapricum desulfuricans]